MTTPVRRFAWPLALAAGALAGAAAAGPRVTETADALARGDCELEVATGRESSSGTPAVRSLEAVVGCGVGGNTQLGLGWARVTAAGLHADGVALLGKTTLVAPDAARTGWAVAYSLFADKPPGGSFKSEELAVSGVATRELLPGWLLHANLGWSHSRSGKQNSTVWFLGVESTDELAVAADVYGDDRSKPWVSAGVGYTLGGGVSASLSYALQLDRPRVRAFTLGAKLAF
jgi:hypothetical protein